MIPEISLKEAKEAFDQNAALFVDIRDPDSYQEAHIENALHLTSQNIEDFISKTDKTQPVIVYCYHGHSSQSATSFLQEKGFKNVKSMMGGFEGWRENYSE